MRLIATFALAVLTLWPVAASAGVLEDLKTDKVLTIGYRQDAAPYSYQTSIGEPAGYMVDLCRAVATLMKQDLGIDDLKVEYVAVGAEDRFTAIQNGKIDLLCGATTATLSRRALVDFSLPTFLDGASVLYRADGPNNFEQLAGQKVGVRAGTTTEKALNATLQRFAISAEVVGVESHDDGLARLESGDISAYFADQGILVFLLARAKAPETLFLSRRYFTHEPYALALPLGDGSFRLAVDSALSRLYRGGLVLDVFAKSFGPAAEPTELLKALYMSNALPE